MMPMMAFYRDDLEVLITADYFYSIYFVTCSDQVDR